MRASPSGPSGASVSSVNSRPRPAARVQAQAELAQGADLRLEERVLRAGIEDDLQLHLAALAPGDAHQLVSAVRVRSRIDAGVHRHEVGEGQLAAEGEEAGAQDVGVAQVGALGAEGPPGSDREAAAAILVEDGSEHRRAVEPRPAEPVERAVAGDQGG